MPSNILSNPFLKHMPGTCLTNIFIFQMPSFSLHHHSPFPQRNQNGLVHEPLCQSRQLIRLHQALLLLPAPQQNPLRTPPHTPSPKIATFRTTHAAGKADGLAWLGLVSGRNTVCVTTSATWIPRRFKVGMYQTKTRFRKTSERVEVGHVSPARRCEVREGFCA